MVLYRDRQQCNQSGTPPVQWAGLSCSGQEPLLFSTAWVSSFISLQELSSGFCALQPTMSNPSCQCLFGEYYLLATLLFFFTTATQVTFQNIVAPLSSQANLRHLAYLIWAMQSFEWNWDDGFLCSLLSNSLLIKVYQFDSFFWREGMDG